MLAQLSVHSLSTAAQYNGQRALVIPGSSDGRIAVVVAPGGVSAGKKLRVRASNLVDATADGMTPLVSACNGGRREDCAALLALGFDPAAESRIRMGCNSFPLLASAGKGHFHLVKWLLTIKGVDVNQASTDTGRTALIIGCEQSQTEVVKVLLAHDGVRILHSESARGLC